MTDRLPLFPLGTVLLPGQRLPLQVFEPRYVRLLEDVMPAPERERCFGVVAIRRGHEVGPGQVRELHDVGCEARIDALAAATTPGGQVYHLVATGVRRFALEGVDEGSEPYAVGRVRWLPRLAGGVAESGATLLREGHAAYVRAVGGSPIDLGADDPELPYRVAGAMALHLGDRQRVLAAAPEHLVEVVQALLRREVAVVTQLGAVPHVPPGGPSPN